MIICEYVKHMLTSIRIDVEFEIELELNWQEFVIAFGSFLVAQNSPKTSDESLNERMH